MARIGIYRTRKKRIFPSAWLWVIVAVTVMKMASGTSLDLHPSSKPCHGRGTTLTCTLPPDNNTNVYQLDDFMWETYTKVIIISNGNMVVLKEPLCSKTKMMVEVHNASKVTTKRNRGSCSLQLVLHDCKGVNIEDGVDLVRMVSSEALKVILPRVSQFDLQDSTVGEVSLTIDSYKSTLINSVIEVVTKLVIQGDFVFQIENSTLGRVKHLSFNSSSDTVLQNVHVNSVLPNGFVVQSGNPTFRNITIKSVESRGIIVMNDAQLKIECGEMETTVPDSIFVTRDGFLSLKNVTFDSYRDISFTVPETSMSLYPLRFLSTQLPIGWIAMAAGSGLVVGGAMAVGFMYRAMRRSRSMKSKVDTNELLTQEQSTSQSGPGSLTKNHSFQSIPVPPNRPQPEPPNRPLPEAPNHPLPGAPNRPLPGAPNRPLPEVPKGVNADEIYTEYMDVLPSAFGQNVLQAGMAQGAPFASTNKSFSAPQGKKGKTLPEPPKRSDNTSKDNDEDFPPPPPPCTQEEEEELYDDLESASSLRPPPPPQCKKPLAPPATGKFKKPFRT